MVDPLSLPHADQWAVFNTRDINYLQEREYIKWLTDRSDGATARHNFSADNKESVWTAREEWWLSGTLHCISLCTRRHHRILKEAAVTWHQLSTHTNSVMHTCAYTHIEKHSAVRLNWFCLILSQYYSFFENQLVSAYHPLMQFEFRICFIIMTRSDQIPLYLYYYYYYRY